MTWSELVAEGDRDKEWRDDDMREEKGEGDGLGVEMEASRRR